MKEEDLDFILVGGYAVSAFSHRFSVDADLVVKDGDLEKFREILEEEGYKEIQKKDLKKPYQGKFISFQKSEELPVTVDLLVNSLGCRQTEASWNFDYLQKNSVEETIEGSEKSLEAKIPEKELLIAIKLHSGRLTDIRDVVALSSNADYGKIKRHVNRGYHKKLKKILEEAKKIIESENFEDSFKGVFEEKKLPEDNIQKVKKFLDNFD